MENSFGLCDTRGMSRETVGAVIRRHRLAASWTQKELAERIGMTDRIVSLWETERNLPNRDSLLRLAKEFQISLDDFNLTEEQLARIDAIIEETPPEDLTAILDEVRAEAEAEPTIIQALRAWLAGWRAHGDGDQSR